MRTNLPTHVRFGRAICGELGEAERREWWLANGLGAYAGGTIAGSLTRRYHGLLIAPLSPPLGRHLVLAKADATLRLGGREHPLFTNRWASGAIAPAGHVHIESFHLDGRMPVWRFALGGYVLEMRIWMEHGRHLTWLAWRLRNAGPGDGESAALRVALLVSARDHHAVARPRTFDAQIEVDGTYLRVHHQDGLDLHLRASGGAFIRDPAWIEHFDLPAERERGLEDDDSHLRVGYASLRLRADRWTGLAAGLEPPDDVDVEAALERSLGRDRTLLGWAAQPGAVLAGAAPGSVPPADADWIAQLVLAADSFLFARPLPGVPNGESVIAGYPWFGDWGRDTMIALPGLTLAVGRPDSARRILLTFARFVDQGMLPNVFPGQGAHPEYNSVDAALWYLEAWRAYVAATGDLAAVETAWSVLRDIIRWHQAGTRYGIGVDSADGLLRAGEPGVQLTWMDVKIGDWVVTPRWGKPVEVNALWYNGLRVMADLAGRLGDDPAPYAELARRAQEGFRRFLRPDGQGLFDVLDGPAGEDASLRPNQILAVSLSHSPLDTDAQAGVVRVCAEQLLTSYGLRSLAPRDAAYRPVYAGGVRERDGGYHQGPVWGWLLGHYVLAEHRVTGDTSGALARLRPLADHLLDAGLGTAGEIFDGAPPHRSRGAPAQAWSVASALEALWRLGALQPSAAA